MRKTKLKRCAAFVLSMLMALTCMPMGAMAEETAETDDSVTVEVILDEPSPDATTEDSDVGEAEIPPEEPAASMEESMNLEEKPSAAENVMIPEESNIPNTENDNEVEGNEESDSNLTEEEPLAENPQDDRPPLELALNAFGAVYVPTLRPINVYSSPVLKKDTLLYTTANAKDLVLATGYTEHGTIVVWFLDADSAVVKGFVSIRDLDDKFIQVDNLEDYTDQPTTDAMTAVGMMPLFMVEGTYPETAVEDEPVSQTEPVNETEPISTPEQDSETDSEIEILTETESMPAPVTDTADVRFVESEDDPEDNAGESDIPVVQQTEASETASPEDQPTAEPVIPDESTAIDAGSYIGVTTKTRVFADIDAQSADNYYSGEYLGNFVKDAAVQIVATDTDEAGNAWYQVRYLYGDDFTDGSMKWTAHATCWVRADETTNTDRDTCTVTDFAYTLEYLKMTKNSGRRMLKAATPMNGFTLKNINGAVGGFYAWQNNLYGSSGHDSEYPQIAKSAAHGLIYATPHYLEGFTVFCLEHNLSGPGEGSGSNQKPKGPYVLVDMDTFVNNSAYGGTTGVRYKASTMHALGWVLRHTYPFMALNRTDANNEVWSRVAGQFAMREVIKQLEGSQYVRSYWDMDNFYSFSGGAPAVYLTYARWLAENGIARASITGNITASNQSTSISGSNYVGTVTLTTDADLIRIPKSVGTLTGNSGGSDSSYYYVKSGDTIQITSSSSRFSVSMESLSSPDEEANFLVGVPSVSIQKILVPVYGAPNILKSGSLTFELSLGEIQVTKKSTDGTVLKGAVFELLNSAGTVIATATTNANGIATFAGLQPGAYTVREKTAPQGFHLATVSTQNVTVTAGVTGKVTFTDPPIQGKIRIVKTDSVTSKPLAGAVFTVKRLSGPDSFTAASIGQIVATLTTNAQGIAETGLLPWGEYEITEISVPDGYVDSGYTTTVKIN